MVWCGVVFCIIIFQLLLSPSSFFFIPLFDFIKNFSTPPFHPSSSSSSLTLLPPHPLSRSMSFLPLSPSPPQGEVYNVEIALDLKELNSITRQRQSVRDNLEKSIAFYEATNVRPDVYIQTGKVRLLCVF